MNSSPPYLALVASFGVESFIISAAAFSTLSPSGCPCVSLYFLKLSMSSIITLTGILFFDSFSRSWSNFLVISALLFSPVSASVAADSWTFSY